MTKPLNFAVIGCGLIARTQHLPNIVGSARMRLHTCCDLSEEVLVECRERFHPHCTTSDWRSAIKDSDIDVVCIATTEKLRLPLIEAAAAAGKAMYIEKPLAQSLPEVYEIQRVIRESGIPFCIGHNRRAAPAMLEARKIFRCHMENPAPCRWRFDREGERRPRLAEDGIPGISVRINDDWYSWKRWVFDKSQAPHGPLLFEMTHFSDICNWFLADEPVEVAAVESNLLNQAAVIRYRGGALATISISNNGSFGYPKELYEFMGNGAVVVVDHMVEVRTAGIENAPDRLTYPLLNDRHPEVGKEGGLNGWLAKRRAACDDAVRKGDPSLILCGDPDKGHAHMLDRFVDQILGIAPGVCGIEDAVRAMEISFAAVRAAQEKRVVRLEEIQEGKN